MGFAWTLVQFVLLFGGAAGGFLVLGPLGAIGGFFGGFLIGMFMKGSMQSNERQAYEAGRRR